MRLPVLASALLFFALPATSVEAVRHHCNPPGAKSVARDERGRVYFIRRDGDQDSYYACLYSTGRTRPLGVNPHSIGDIEMTAVDIAMPFVAFEETEYSSQGSGSFLSRLNMRSGRTLALDTQGELKRFVATSFGAVVWAQYRPSLGTTEIEKHDKDGEVTLDEGAHIDAKSLRLSRSGHRVYWHSDGLLRSARLR